MKTLREAAEEFYESIDNLYPDVAEKLGGKLKQALSQDPEQGEPVAWMDSEDKFGIGVKVHFEQLGTKDIPLYTHPSNVRRLRDSELHNLRFASWDVTKGDYDMQKLYDSIMNACNIPPEPPTKPT